MTPRSLIEDTEGMEISLRTIDGSDSLEFKQLTLHLSALNVISFSIVHLLRRSISLSMSKCAALEYSFLSSAKN